MIPTIDLMLQLSVLCRLPTTHRQPALCRLLSTAVAATMTSRASLEEQLQEAPWLLLLQASRVCLPTSRPPHSAILQGARSPAGPPSKQICAPAALHQIGICLQVPGAGRGLFASKDIEQGMVVHEEAPMLWTSHPDSLAATCHSCLRPLAPSGGSAQAGNLSSSDSSTSTGSSIDRAHGRSGSSGAASRLRFCSTDCRAEAEGTWAAAAADCNLAPLQQACRDGGDKFPLMAAQLACMQVQRWEQQDGGPGQQATAGNSGSSTDAAASGAAAAASWQEGPVARGDALSQLRHLCYANTPQPPEPWVRMHSLLLQGLQPLAGSARWAAACTPERLRREFSLGWFCDMLARLHLNAFR